MILTLNPCVFEIHLNLRRQLSQILQLGDAGEGWVQDTGYFLTPTPSRLQMQATTKITLTPTITVIPR
jgi:hypothetical protein